MTETIADVTTTTSSYPGDAPRPRRNGVKPLLPGSWVSRSIRADYRDGDGRGQTISGKLLDLYPAGMVLGASGARVLLAWDAVIMVELVGD